MYYRYKQAAMKYAIMANDGLISDAVFEIMRIFMARKYGVYNTGC